MERKRRLKGYQHLSASGHLSAVLEGGQVFGQLRGGIEETKSLFLFLSEHIHMLDPDNTTPLSMDEWLSLKKIIAQYAKKHTDIQRSQVLFVLTVLRGTDELHRHLKEITMEQVKEAAGDQEPLEFWFTRSKTSQWLTAIMELFFLGRDLRDKSPILREHLWALAGRALKEIIIPFYQKGRQLNETAWWQYFVAHGWVTPLSHIRHPYDAVHAEEWRRGIIAAIAEEEHGSWL